MIWTKKRGYESFTRPTRVEVERDGRELKTILLVPVRKGARSQLARSERRK
jgi:hypothetical protein